MNQDPEYIAMLAQRGQLEPETLTLEEVRELGLFVLLRNGEQVESDPSNPN